MISVTDVTTLIGSYLPEPHAGLLSGMLLGTKEQISRDAYNALVTTGTLHIVALSGTNITILANLTVRVLLTVFSRRIALVLACVIIIGFVWFVGPSPSVVRAAIMGCLTLLAVVFGRQVWALWSLITALVLMVAVKPDLPADVSFQLSAGAALGLILFGPSGRYLCQNDTLEIISYDSLTSSRVRAIFMRLGYFWRLRIWPVMRFTLETDFRTTMAAQTFTIPIILLTFHRMSLISPVSNLLIGWMLTPLTAFGMLLVFAAFVSPPLATVVSWVIWVGTSYVLAVIELTSKVPFAGVGW